MMTRPIKYGPDPYLTPYEQTRSYEYTRRPQIHAPPPDDLSRELKPDYIQNSM